MQANNLSLNKNLVKYFIGILLGVLSLILKSVGSSYPHWIENWYSNGLFPVLRSVLDSVHQIAQIPLFYFSLIFVLVLLVFIFRSTYKEFRINRKKSLLHLVLKITGIAGYVLFWFYWFWGFNYDRISLEDNLGYTLDGMNKIETLEEYHWVSDQVIDLADSLPISNWRKDTFQFNPTMEHKIRSGVKQVLSDFKFNNNGNPPLRFINPKGALLRISTAGFYWPLTGESHVDDGMYPLQWPYVIAHELFHGYGITDEGDCNFLALLACIKTGSVEIKYSALVGYWRYVAREARFHLGEEYSELTKLLPRSFKNDLNNIYIYLDKYPDIMPKARNAIYNSYLKSQGIKEGLKSYNRVVMLHNQWRSSNGLN